MTPDPTVPPQQSEPATQAYPAHDPWGGAAGADDPTTHVAVAPAGNAPTAPQHAAPPGGYPVAPAFPPPVDPPATAQLPAAPFAATAPFSAPPATTRFPTQQAPFSAPPAQPGPYPPVSAQPSVLPAGWQPAGAEVVAVQIAEIMVTPPVIRTPAGVLPLAGTSWHVADFWQKEEKVASWAVVCAILGFFCLTFFSLLFLLVKETRHSGTVQVTVTNGARQYVARIPVVHQGQVQEINNQVNYARSLSAC